MSILGPQTNTGKSYFINQIECWLKYTMDLHPEDYTLKRIVTYKGGPQYEINMNGRDVDLKYFRLNELPDYIQFGEIKNGSFDCSESQLSSAKGFPHTVGKRFNCRDSKITSLDGMPKEVGEHFVWTNSSFTEEEIRSKVKVTGRVYR